VEVSKSWYQIKVQWFHIVIFPKNALLKLKILKKYCRNSYKQNWNGNICKCHSNTE